MTQWFRFYIGSLDDPKVQKLDGETYKAWVNLLCLAAKNDGKLPPIDDIAFALRIDRDGALTVLERLLNATLIDRSSGGCNGYSYAPHNWSKRQYKSDTSTARVKRFRKRSETVTETAPDTDTESEQNIPPKSPKGGVKCPDDIPADLWQDFRRHRKAPITQKALEGFRREAQKAGWTLERAITESIERGWQGFKAEWVRNKPLQNSDGWQLPIC